MEQWDEIDIVYYDDGLADVSLESSDMIEG